jgi:hypothetical protein
MFLTNLTNRFLTDFTNLTENIKIKGCRNKVGELTNFVGNRTENTINRTDTHP